jgi:SAM-dependent methyltransferase
MINVEAAFLRVDEHLRLRRVVRPFLRSELAWRMSGLTFASAVVATTGSYSSPDEYLASLAERMSCLSSWFSESDRVLEFGSGLGGNLIGIASKIDSGYGVDVNPYFTRIAERLSKKKKVVNLKFVTYGGLEIPRLYPLDVVLSIGVFERLPKSQVLGYLKQFKSMLSENGTLILYFLTRRAIHSGFGQVLGPESYVAWESEELESMFSQLGLNVRKVLPRFLNSGDTYILGKESRPEGGILSPAESRRVV